MDEDERIDNVAELLLGSDAADSPAAAESKAADVVALAPTMETDADQQLADVQLAVEAAADEAEAEAISQLEQLQSETEAAVQEALAAELAEQDADEAADRPEGGATN